MTAKIKALAPWFGGKRTLASDIVAEMGAHRAFYDLGCGSLAVTLAKPVSSHETVVDLHWHLINLARVIQELSTAVELYERLVRTVCSEEIFDRSRAVIEDKPMLEEDQLGDVDLAYHYFVSQWIGRNGVSGTKRLNYQMAVRWTPGGGHGGIRFRSATESLPWWHERLKPVLILRRDIWDIIPKIDDVPGVVIYVDPPYLSETRAGGCQYEHEFKQCEDLPLFLSRDEAKKEKQTHEGLALMLQRFKKARVLVSYYDNHRLADLYPGWTIKKMYRQKNLHVQNRRGMGECEAPEVLLINSPEQQEMF